jgi:hypothetical protein
MLRPDESRIVQVNIRVPASMGTGPCRLEVRHGDARAGIAVDAYRKRIKATATITSATGARGRHANQIATVKIIGRNYGPSDPPERIQPVSKMSLKFDSAADSLLSATLLLTGFKRDTQLAANVPTTGKR